jgi:peptide/nickel transport system permease protein
VSRAQFILFRCVQMIPVAFGITLVVFALLQLIPGDPAATMLGIHGTPESVAALRRELGLDRPIWEQYVRYISSVLTLDLGESLKYKVSVSSLLGDRLALSLQLIAFATLLIVVIALPLGIASAIWKDSLFDQIVRIGLMVTMVMPGFWVGIVLLTVFSVKFGLFPVSGAGDGAIDRLHHLLLPALTIALGIVPLLVRALRTSILEAMQADYVRTARAKGLGNDAVVAGHVLRNALIPAVTLLGLSVGYLMGGTVVIENVFSLPGAGKLLVDAITARDYPVVQSTTLVFAMLVIMVNLGTDLIYTFLDPRVRLG